MSFSKSTHLIYPKIDIISVAKICLLTSVIDKKAFEFQFFLASIDESELTASMLATVVPPIAMWSFTAI